MISLPAAKLEESVVENHYFQLSVPIIMKYTTAIVNTFVYTVGAGY